MKKPDHFSNLNFSHISASASPQNDHNSAKISFFSQS